MVMNTVSVSVSYQLFLNVTIPKIMILVKSYKSGIVQKRLN